MKIQSLSTCKGRPCATSVITSVLRRQQQFIILLYKHNNVATISEPNFYSGYMALYKKGYHYYYYRRPTNLVEHILQVRLRIHPGCDGITEEDKVLYNATRVDPRHRTDPAESRVLLVVVTNVSQRRAPVVSKAVDKHLFLSQPIQSSHWTASFRKTVTVYQIFQQILYQSYQILSSYMANLRSNGMYLQTVICIRDAYSQINLHFKENNYRIKNVRHKTMAYSCTATLM